MQVQGTQPQVQPTTGSKVGHVAVNIGLSVGAGIAADQLRKSAARLGSVQSVAIGLAGAAAVKAVGEGAVQVISNIRHDQKWNANLGEKMLDGVRTGTLDGGLTFAAAPIARGVGGRLPQLGTVARHATAGLVIGSLGGAAYAVTDHKTWKQGAGEGLKTVGVSTAFGAAGGAVIGAGTGAVMKRFFPEYKGGDAVTEHEVRTLARQRGQQPRPDLPELNNDFAAAAANAKKVTNLNIPKGSKMADLLKTPEFKAFVKDLKPGDIILGGRGTKTLAWATRSPFTHAMVVTEANGTVAGTKVVEAIETGVVKTKLAEALSHYVPGSTDAGGEIQGAYTIIRPTNDPAIAAKAVAWSEKQVGQGYDYDFVRDDDLGKFCSELAYNAYDTNPAIAEPQIKLLQLDEDVSRLHMIAKAGRNGSVGQMMKRDWLGIYDAASKPKRMAMKVQDHVNLAAGLVEYGAGKVGNFLSKDGGKVYTPGYRYERPMTISPGDLNLADGRKIHTLMLELVTPGKP